MIYLILSKTEIGKCAERFLLISLCLNHKLCLKGFVVIYIPILNTVIKGTLSDCSRDDMRERSHHTASVHTPPDSDVP